MSESFKEFKTGVKPVEDEKLIEALLVAKELLTKESDAHSEITMILPNGEVVIIPAKNEHLLQD